LSFADQNSKPSERRIHRIILTLMQTAEVVEVVSKFSLVESGSLKTIWLLRTTYDGSADFVVSGDKPFWLEDFKEIKKLV